MAETTVPDADAPSRVLDEDELLARLKSWFQSDYDHHKEWMDGVEKKGGAREDFDFVAGHQWDEEALRVLEAQGRPASVFNRCAPMIDSVTGFEVSNRQETRYLPRKLGSTAVNEILTGAAEWFRDQTDAEDEESDAFRDACIAGKGWTETRVDYESNPDGDPRIERIDPMEVFADRDARKPNLTDAKRVWRVRRVSYDEAKAMFPEVEAESLSAGWATDDHTETPSVNRPEDDYDHTSHQGTKADCTIVECQWWEREPFVRYADGSTGEEVEVPLDEFVTMMDRLEKLPPEMLMLMGIMPPQGMVTQYRRVYRRAFIGKVLLEPAKPTPVDGHFTYKCITGKRDQNKGHFFGLVRAMKDPQKWTNKLFSQIMHILNSNSKGGIMAERGAFEDDRKAGEDWAKGDAIVWLEDGALSNPNKPKIQPKPPVPFPDGQAQMLQFAMGAMPMVTGVNMEFLGMREAEQAGVLEYQRRQAGVTILATLFDSLRRYRKDQGRLMLRMIQEYLADGRLVKIVEDDQVKYLPLDRTTALGDYEVIVDEAPSSPNAKERNWQIISSMLPIIQPAMTPQIAANLFRYSPLPEGVVSQIVESMTAPPPPPSPEAVMMQQVDLAKKIAEVDKDAAAAEKSRADAMARQAATMAELTPFMAMVNPNLAPAPVPSGPINGLNIPRGAMTPPPLPHVSPPPGDGPGMSQPPMMPMPQAQMPPGMGM